MGNPSRRLGWQPGSYKAVQRDGHFPGGPNARGAFDGGRYDNGPQPPPPAPVAPPPRPSPATAARKAAEAVFVPVPAQSPTAVPKAKPKPWKQPPFAIGDTVICGARHGTYRPCDCGNSRLTVTLRKGFAAVLKCTRCGESDRGLPRADLTAVAVNVTGNPRVAIQPLKPSGV